MSHEAQRLYERLLVLRCQTGDEEAFRELVDRYARRLHYYLRKLLPPTVAIDDIIQEVWIDVFRQLPGLQDAGAFPTWIYRIARGKASLQMRRKGRALPTIDDTEAAASTAAEDEEEFPREDAMRIHAALDRLPAEQREVLVLRFLQELSYEEIGLVVGAPLGTVRSRIHYGKRALRQLLDSDR